MQLTSILFSMNYDIEQNERNEIMINSLMPTFIRHEQNRYTAE